MATPVNASNGMKIYTYMTTDNPNSKLVVITPGYTLEEITGTLKGRYGHRFISVAEKK
jgi:hypothetical protein